MKEGNRSNGGKKAKVEINKKTKEQIKQEWEQEQKPQPQEKPQEKPQEHKEGRTYKEHEQEAAKKKVIPESKLKEIAENLYMILCKAFHPDRQKVEEAEEDTEEKFRELQKKYESGDSSGIIFMGLEADKIDVEEELGDDIVEDVQQELQQKIGRMKHQLQEMKSNIAWVWNQKRSRKDQQILRHRIIQKMRQDVLRKK